MEIGTFRNRKYPLFHTNTSLNKAGEICFRLAKGRILSSGGKLPRDNFILQNESISLALFEESFIGIIPSEKKYFGKKNMEFNHPFSGTGLVVMSKLIKKGNENQGDNIIPTVSYVGQILFQIDNLKPGTVPVPINRLHIRQELYSRYPGSHTLQVWWLNPAEGFSYIVKYLLTYQSVKTP